MMNLLKFLQFEANLLRISGFYPGINSFWQNFSCFVNLTLAFGQLLSMIILLGTLYNNLMELVSSSLLFVTHLGFVCKLMNFIARQKTLQQIESILQNEQSLNLKEFQIVEKAVKRFDLVAFTFRFACVVVLSITTLVTFLEPKAPKPLPLPGWVPWSLNNNFNYIFTFSFQLLSIFLSAYNNSTMDMLNCKLITICTAKFQILIVRLKDNQSDFKTTIKFHVKTLELVTKIEKTFSYGILVQYLASLLVICFTGFQMIVVNFVSLQFVSLLLYLLTMLLQVATYCWYGHNLMTKSLQLNEACYMSDWHLNLTNQKQDVLIFMERAKKPIILTAGKFFNLSLTTLTRILRSAYSYFAVLQRLYAETL